MATEDFKLNTDPAERSLQELIDMLIKTGRAAGMSEKQIQEMVDETKRARTEGVKNVSELKNSMGGLNNTIKQIGGTILGVFALDRIKAFVGEVVKVTAEFQKLEAVLTNTLGSKGEAQRALKTIQEIAAKTPFSVLQLAQSYVKLVNQGIKPTAAEIIKLGDLAASTGKEFDQLTEAIIDAQTGEFERLKEFGIRASKAGDQVTFTFKGVQTQVDFTSESIKNYILQLGDLQGVSGSMSAISETLGGQISNLGDSWDTLLRTLGDGNKGPLFFTVELMKDLVDELTTAFTTSKQLAAAQESGREAAAVDAIMAEVKAYSSLEKARTLIAQSLDTEEKRLKARNDEIYNGAKAIDGEYTANFNRLDQIDRERNALNELIPKLIQERDLKSKTDADKAKADALKKLEKAYFEISGIDEKAVEVMRREQAVLTETEALIKRMIGDMPELQKLVDSIMLPESEKAANPDEPWGKDWLDIRKQNIESFKNYTISAINEIFRSQVLATQMELALLENKHSTEIELAGENKKAQQVAEKNYQKERARLMQQQAEQEQEAAIFGILVNLGPAVAKTLAQGGAFAIPLVAAMTALFAIQLANTKKVAMPRFAAEGEYGIEGPGTETSDSIPYMLSRSESVVHAKGSKRFKDLLKPMIENKDFGWADVARIVDDKLPAGLPPILYQKAVGADSGELLDEMRKTRRAIETKQESRVQFDENGFKQWVGRAGSWESYVQDRYNRKQ